MKILQSYLFDLLNSGLAFIQNKTDKIRQNSFLLNNIDLFILAAVIITYVLSVFTDTNTMAIASFFVPVLVFLKVLITKGENIELERCNFYLIIYLLICLISNFTSSMLPESIYGFMKTLMYIGFYFAICQFLKSNKKYITFLLLTIGLLVCFESIAGIIQNSMHLENISTWQDVSYLNPEDVLCRVYGTLKPYNPNLLGGYLIAGISSILGISILLFDKKYYKSAIIGLILFLISSFGVFLTGSRGAYVALFVIYIGIAAASYKVIFSDINLEKYKRMWKQLFSIGVICSVLFMIINHRIFQRLMSLFILRGDSSTSFRLNVYNSSLQMFHDNWLFGIGVGNKVFREIYGLYMLTGYDALSSYCIFLEMAVESGIFSLIAYLLFIFILMKEGIKVFRNTTDIRLKSVLFTAIISIAAVLCHGIFDTIYFRPPVQYLFWTMAGIITVLTREEKIQQ